jgi:hypothetical protein
VVLRNAASAAVVVVEAVAAVVVMVAVAAEAVAAVAVMVVAVVETATVADSTEEATINLRTQSIMLKSGNAGLFFMPVLISFTPDSYKINK